MIPDLIKSPKNEGKNPKNKERIIIQIEKITIILNPDTSNPRGRPNNSRMKSPLEAKNPRKREPETKQSHQLKRMKFARVSI